VVAGLPAHLQEAFQIGVQAGDWTELVNGLEYCGHLCASTGRPAEAITVWAAADAINRRAGSADRPEEARRQEEPLRQARHGLGDARAHAAEERGATMSMATAAEFALLLTTPRPQQPTVTAGLGMLSAREKELVTLVARGTPTPRSPGSCSSASAPSAPTWTGSATRPAAAAAPTSPG
jgi:hypothetical protein